MKISTRISTYSQWLSNSFKQHIGEELYPCDSCLQEELALRLYEAPIVIVSHGTEEDPVFNYANEAAQRLWEMDWDEFSKTALPVFNRTCSKGGAGSADAGGEEKRFYQKLSGCTNFTIRKEVYDQQCYTLECVRSLWYL